MNENKNSEVKKKRIEMHKEKKNLEKYIFKTEERVGVSSRARPLQRTKKYVSFVYAKSSTAGVRNSTEDVIEMLYIHVLLCEYIHFQYILFFLHSSFYCHIYEERH